MKFLKLIIVTALLIGLSNSQGCKEVFKTGEMKATTKTAVAIAGSGQIYPGDLDPKQYKTTFDNALIQTKAARNLFYKPSPATISLLKNVASNLKSLTEDGGFPSSKVIEFIISGEQRQASVTGTGQEYQKAWMSILKPRAKTDTKDTEAINWENEFKIATITEIIERVAKNPEATDILPFLGFVGDLFTCVQDVNGRNDNDPKKTSIVNFLSTKILNLGEASKKMYEKYSPDHYYEQTTDKDNKKIPKSNDKQSKPKERSWCQGASTDKNQMKLDARAGVMGTGEAADKALGITKGLPLIGWPWQTVPEKLVNFCKDEPWAGHFSGSLYEQMFGLQILSSPAVNGKWDASKEPDTASKDIIAALSSAFLVGTGMHSSIEVALVVKMYRGTAFQIPINLEDAKEKTVITSLICSTGDNSSTTYIAKLHTDNSAKKRRKLK